MCCLVLGSIGPNAQADDTDPSPPRSYGEAVYLLETWIESIIDFDRLPGLSIAIVHDQELVYSNGFGFADVERRIDATPSTVYSICSISKLLTAIALMQLRDAGEVNLDEPVSSYLPWFEPGAASPAAGLLTLRELLRHSSGLPCEPDHTVWSDPDSLSPSREELVERLSHLTMSYPTGTEFNYSNLGYTLLGEVVSTVSGLDYADYVQQHILDPIGLESTTLHVPGGQLRDDVATGYGRWPRSGDRPTVVPRDARVMTPAGGLASTVEDMARFAMWQFRVLEGADESVLSRSTLREMQTEQWSSPAWGLGFTIWRMGDASFYGHQGGCPGFKSQIILNPDDQVAVVVMINATDAPQFTLAFRAYEIMAPALVTSTETPENDSWSSYTGYYTAVESWSEAEVLTWEGSLALMWIPTGDPIGSLTRLRRIEDHIFRQVRNDSTLGKHYVFKADPDGNIVGLRFNNNLLSKVNR
jgi:CubicO group peptidase (beta-lactamase class C family)